MTKLMDGTAAMVLWDDYAIVASFCRQGWVNKMTPKGEGKCGTSPLFWMAAIPSLRTQPKENPRYGKLQERDNIVEFGPSLCVWFLFVGQFETSLQMPGQVVPTS